MIWPLEKCGIKREQARAKWLVRAGFSVPWHALLPRSPRRTGPTQRQRERASRFAQTRPAKIARLPSTEPRKGTHRGCCRRSRRARRAAAGRTAAGTAPSVPARAPPPRGPAKKRDAPPGSRTVWWVRSRWREDGDGEGGDVTSSSGGRWGWQPVVARYMRLAGEARRGGSLRAGGFVFSEVLVVVWTFGLFNGSLRDACVRPL